MRVSTKARDDDALVTYSNLSPMEDKNKTHDKMYVTTIAAHLGPSLSSPSAVPPL